MLNHYKFVMFCSLHCVTLVLGCLLLLHNESNHTAKLTCRRFLRVYIYNKDRADDRSLIAPPFGPAAVAFNRRRATKYILKLGLNDP